MYQHRQSEPDRRRAHRIVLHLLATDAQLAALQEAIGTALCGTPGPHEGACRIAWGMSRETGDGTPALDPATTWRILVELSPVEVWPAADVDRSLGIPSV